MKRLSVILVFSIILLSTLNVNAQSVNQDFQLLQQSIENVTIKDVEYEQSIVSGENHCLLSISVNNVEDQEEIVYQFNATDINPFTVGFDTNRRSILVAAETAGGRDLIQISENDEIEGYDDELEFYALDIENARTIVEHFKALVDGCQAEQESVDFILGNDPTPDQAIRFLRENITDLTVNDQQLSQEFGVDEAFKALTRISIIDENESETLEYRFNIADINPTTITFSTDDEFVVIEGETRGERDLIEVYENGKKDNYDNQFLFYAGDIEEAREITAVLQFFSYSLEDITNAELARVDQFNELAQLNAFLGSKVVDVVIDEDNYKQTFEFQQENPYLVTYISEHVNDGELDEYTFNLIDINEESIQFDLRRNEVNIEFETVQEKKVIRYTNNGELDGYEDQITIRGSDIESARVLVKTLKKAVEVAKENEPEFLSGNTNPSKSQTQQFLTDSMAEVVIGDDSYNQSIQFTEGNECLLSYEVHDISDEEVIEYKFNLKDINIRKVTFETNREEVFVYLETEGENDLIEVIEDGETDDFENEVNIRATGIEEARSITSAFKNLITICDKE